jgi:hypothetical protein
VDNIFIGCTSYLTLDKVRVTENSQFQNTGICTYVLKDSKGLLISSGILGYVTSSDGRYRVTLGADITGTLKEKRYLITVTFIQGENQLVMEKDVLAVYKQ